MERGLFDITANTVTELIPIYGTRGNVRSIRLSNYSAADDITIDLYLEDGSANLSYIINDLVIPVATTLLLTEELSFDNSVLGMKIVTSGTTPLLSVIIK